MDLLIKEVKTTKKVQNNIEKFESLTLNESKSRSQSASSTKSPNLIVEVEAPSQPVPLLTEISTRPTRQTHKTVLPEESSNLAKQIRPQHERKQSSIYIKQEYLNKGSTKSELADDAREILKCQPGIEDIEAVLTYIQYGIDGQHDFNIKVTGPKSSALLRVLVTTTTPDVWPSFKTSEDESLKKTLLNAMFCVTGLELLLEQIRTLSRTSLIEKHGVLDTYLEVLAALLQGTDTVLRFLRDTTHLYQKDVQRRLFWQGVVALIGGSKILVTTAALPQSSYGDRGSTGWLTVGAEYSDWLAKNIVIASIGLESQNMSDWTDLCQIFRRGLSLGYRGKLYPPF